MDAVTESGTLLVGTNTFAILTQSITDWVNFNGSDDGVQNPMIGYDDSQGDEEYKFEEMDGSNYDQYDDRGYDVMEGQTVDEALDEIRRSNQTGALAQLQAEQAQILA